MSKIRKIVFIIENYNIFFPKRKKIKKIYINSDK